MTHEALVRFSLGGESPIKANEDASDRLRSGLLRTVR